METADLILMVVNRAGALLSIAMKAALAGDEKAVNDILPDPSSYPDEHAYNKIQAQADIDYGPSSK